LLQPDPDPPVPVHAEITAAGRVFACQFDKPLKVQPLNEANWIGVAYHQKFVLNWCFVDGDTVVGNPRYGEADFHPGRVTYLATPADVQSDQAVPADPFTAFPVQEH
jgi:hypothetical protein